jgi:hypothetical protein
VARAEYIWTIQIHGQTTHCFTVKHELISWLRRSFPAGALRELDVVRFRDGGSVAEAKALGTAGALLAEETNRG